MGGDSVVLRVFEVRARAGKLDELKAKLSSVSITVVQGEPGNAGYLFGAPLPCGEGPDQDERDLVFISIWRDMSSIKARFGEHWAQSHLPDGYAELIEHCSLKHITCRGEITL